MRLLLLALLLAMLGCSSLVPTHSHRIANIWADDATSARVTTDLPAWHWEDIECDPDGCWMPDWTMPELECDHNRCWMPGWTEADIRCARDLCWMDAL